MNRPEPILTTTERESYLHALDLVAELGKENAALQAAIREITGHMEKFENLPDNDFDEYQSSLHVWVESLTVSLARASYLLPERAPARTKPQRSRAEQEP